MAGEQIQPEDTLEIIIRTAHAITHAEDVFARYIGLYSSDRPVTEEEADGAVLESERLRQSLTLADQQEAESLARIFQEHRKKDQ